MRYSIIAGIFALFSLAMTIVAIVADNMPCAVAASCSFGSWMTGALIIHSEDARDAAEETK